MFVKCFLWASPIPGTFVGSASFHPNYAVRQGMVSYQLADMASGESDSPGSYPACMWQSWGGPELLWLLPHVAWLSTHPCLQPRGLGAVGCSR